MAPKKLAPRMKLAPPTMLVHALLETGVVPMTGTTDRFVGAVVDPEATKAAGGKLRFEILPGPHRVPFDAYYRRAVQEGHLMAADEASAKLAGVTHWGAPAVEVIEEAAAEEAAVEEPDTIES